jgi:hypothetical protein
MQFTRESLLGCGREGTAHFRRLAPPSFAAQNPLQGAAIVDAHGSVTSCDAIAAWDL